ncbi:mevalonate kinase [Candidatus Nitrosotenuis cloacae]|uniref:mevalonate kinase n=1 Tax=Candidatus Nitrosotenuis cloacae TaxID=1603555 RepID=A0A3G1B6N3_9ARCH|nr:mevalonate kinase [Candidatus Nitrosotenuis cloacae]AJZ75729.1 mevalonate kinase [Candidatus Nitrosotenuis cloacae]
MKSIASAPAKVILFGEHFIIYGGKAILCSIDKRITVESELIDDNTIQISSDLGSITSSRDESIKNTDPKFGPLVFIAQKILKQFESKSGLKISIKSEIPSGVGLGSSSACCVAAASSISGLFTNYSKDEIVKIAIEAERTVFENASGADTSICTFGGIMEYTKQETKNLDLKPKFHLVIANSKMIHSTSEVVLRVKQFREKQVDEFALLCQNESSLIEEALDALKRNDLGLIGEKMLINQTHLQKIGVSNQTLDEMIRAIKGISYGAKITGAGDGGCIVILVDESNLQKTLDALKNYECFATKIDTLGVEQKTIKNTT